MDGPEVVTPEERAGRRRRLIIMLAIVAGAAVAFTVVHAVGGRQAQAEAEPVAASMTTELAAITDTQADSWMVSMAMGQVPDLNELFPAERGRVTGTLGKHQLAAFVEVRSLLDVRCVRATIDGPQRDVSVFEPTTDQQCFVDFAKPIT